MAREPLPPMVRTRPFDSSKTVQKVHSEDTPAELDEVLNHCFLCLLIIFPFHVLDSMVYCNIFWLKLKLSPPVREGACAASP